MFSSEDIRPITEFLRNHKGHYQQLRATGRPEVLTINGRPELVLQDVRAFERAAAEARKLREENRALRERLEELETLAALDDAYAEFEDGEGQPMKAALAPLRKRVGIESLDR